MTAEPDRDAVEGAMEPGLGAGAVPDELPIHYVKSNFFRVVCADGAWGGFSPGGRLIINFYNERAPIPLVQTHAVGTDGRLGPIK